MQAALNSRAPKVTHPRVTTSHYLLSGLIHCHKCGAAYIGYGAKSGRFHYCVCGTTYSKGKETCPSQHLPKENTDLQDKIEEMRRARLEIEEALQTRRLEPIDPRMVLDYVRDLKEFLEESNIFERRAFLR